MRWQDTGRGGTLYYPVWLAYAAAVLETEYEVKLADAPASNWSRTQVIEDIVKFRPDLIVVDTSFPSLNNDISVAEAIKQAYPSAEIVLVGPPASQFADTILESSGIDFVARWEYDFTLKAITRALQRGDGFEHIKGISYKKDGIIIHNPDRAFSTSEELDEIPFVSKVYQKHLNIRDYFLGNSLYPEVQIFTGRGCPFQCTFCSWPQTLMGRQYRLRSIASVLDELEWIEENLPEVKEVFFEDDTFTVDKKRVLAFIQEYRRRGLNITWACNSRVDLDYETMRAMKGVNCRLVIAGYESGDAGILRNIKKGITIEDIRRFACDARRAGLLVLGDFVIGLPGETKDTVEETRKLIKEVKPELLQVSVATPFPGTEFYAWARSHGYLLTDNPSEYLDEQGHQKAIISYPELSGVEMVETVDKILKDYYLSPAYIPLAIRQVWRKNSKDELVRLWHQSRSFVGYVRGR
jgi:radical SAM superfamily enzyme YgiQ (UPF0313 family)